MGLPDPQTLPPNGRRMEAVVAAVREAIDDGRMRPNVRYSVYQLAESLGVSRTPVREALLRLEEVGLVEFQARQGFQILLPRAADIADIFAVRLALELPAVRRVAATGCPPDRLERQRDLMRAAAAAGDERAFVAHDQRLHDLILELAGNARARGIVRGLRETTRLLGASTAEKTRTLVDIDAEHAPIVDALLRGQPDTAAAAMEAHLVSTGKLLVGQALRDEVGHADPAEIEAVWAAAN
ncbi:GntR family transcriptional regulator [Mycobacterium sp. ACS4331]|uniref:GntR family transcriptional regulator n=1 Tax=Mycobacterium sp. ACS4331 TaxID=1834121 RepID=UPI0007FD9A45|nr:GntR family transcriptional regulator [Mycobacterium sp. ACS4331]OBF28632.1 GntR family transcriptional regulator [Mycobacterium sp. ACS4331]